MKMTFSLHLRCFMMGIIILFAFIMLMLGIPSYEESALAEIFEDILDFEDMFVLNVTYLLFVVFLAYMIGVCLDILYSPLKNSSKLSMHVRQFKEMLSKREDIITRLESKSEEGKLSDLEVYKYMSSFIASMNDTLNKEVQNALFKVYIIFSSIVASFLFFLAFAIQLFTYEYDDEFISFAVLALFFLICIFFLFPLKKRSQISLIKAIERNYYILTQCGMLKGNNESEDDKINIEIS